MIRIIKAWQDILGIGNVVTNRTEISTVETATFATKQRVLAIISPCTTEEVCKCIKIANEYQTPIYPISCGKNWGLGSKVPVADNCVIMDLSKLNRILDYNEKLAYITVEPGVTFNQAYQFLQEQKSNLYLSVIGGSPHSSLIGNTLERGDGVGPNGDRTAYVCGFEVVLPTGECVNTGFGRFSNSKATKVDRWGVGPYFDGIFVQSNLGVVTKMTVWLTPKPKYVQDFTCIMKHSSSLETMIDTLQRLVLEGTINDNCFHFWNSYKILAREGTYPWKIMKGKTPLSLQEFKGAEPWFGTGQLYAVNKEQASVQKKLIEEAFAEKVDQLIFFDEQKDDDQSLELGVPSNLNVKSTYWRKKKKMPFDLDPDRDGCGVIWLCPLLPFDGQEIINAIAIAQSTIKSYQFEPNIAINCISARSIRMFIAIMYDRENPGEDERGMECHDQLLQQLIEQGYIPYRLGIQSMNSLPSAQDDYGKLISTLKKSLDPNNILAPGRYDFRNGW